MNEIKVLGLDISSSTIGWALLSLKEKEVKVLQHGHIKPLKSIKGTLSERLSDTYNKVLALLDKVNPDEIVVEDYLKKFTKGKSSAHTIMILSVFNEVSCLVCKRHLDMEAKRYSVSKVRSLISKHLDKEIVSKEEIFPVMCEVFKDNFKLKNNRNDNIKVECYDEADAIAVGFAYIIDTYL